MPLPEFTDAGDLPPGVYPVTLSEALVRFGAGSDQRQVIGGRLAGLYRLVAATGHLARFVVFGSFVTAKSEPRDLDLVLIMEDDFDVSRLSGPTATVFDHSAADERLGASVFWSTRSGAFGGEQAMVEYWQVTRGGGSRGILEIVPEVP